MKSARVTARRNRKTFELNESVDELKRIADATNTVLDYRIYKNRKNRHIKEMKKKKRAYMTKIYGKRKKMLL